MKSVHVDKVILADLNINSLRNKFDSLIGQITGSIDILMVSETKLDEIFFPIGQFIIEGFGVPYRVDRNDNGGGICEVICERRHSFKTSFCRNFCNRGFSLK